MKTTRGAILKEVRLSRADRIARQHAQATIASASYTLREYYRALASIFQSVESNARSRRSIIRRIDRMCKTQITTRKGIASERTH